MFLLVQRESIDLALAITFHVHITDVYSGFNATRFLDVLMYNSENIDGFYVLVIIK